jgi:hypothetical protein
MMPYQTRIKTTEPLAVAPETAADLIDSTESTLEKDRATGHLGIPYVKAGRRVVYRVSDLRDWLKANLITPQSSHQSNASNSKLGGL